MITTVSSGTEVLKALADPVRWQIVCQMAMVDELARNTLEDTLPVSKPTISYHTKLLIQAGLVDVRKEGRNSYYTLRRRVLRELMDELRTLAPGSRPVQHAPARVDAAGRELVLLTW